jgi:hypothetical protein
MARRQLIPDHVTVQTFWQNVGFAAAERGLDFWQIRTESGVLNDWIQQGMEMFAQRAKRWADEEKPE